MPSIVQLVDDLADISPNIQLSIVLQLDLISAVLHFLGKGADQKCESSHLFFILNETFPYKYEQPIYLKKTKLQR